MFYRVVTAVSLAMLLFGLGAWRVAADPPLPLQVHMYQGIPYISGGVGDEELALLQTQSRAYNVKLTFAAKEGHYLAEIPIAIVDSQGRKVLEAVAEGPVLYTKLPPGTYNVIAQADGKTHQQKVQVTQQQQAQLLFAW
jgi:hypothetical protein